ncbi:MAG: hypothetical protein HOH43_26075 [Candidatus Latescibacteria bacterium]|nr:hypothetical protein [Candidatus Latescibacterota bacterium]
MRFAGREPGSDAQSVAGKLALERALERGVNFVHSSFEYGTRWAMGEVMRSHSKRHDLHHVIKVPVPDFDDGGVFDKAKFRTRVEEALRELHTDRIAVLQHLQRFRPNSDDNRIPNISAVNEPMMEIFEKLREEGKVGYLTTFPYTTDFARSAMGTGCFSGIVAYYNTIEMEMSEFFDDLQEKGQGFLCIRPFMAGLLTDRRADRKVLPLEDRNQDDLWDEAYGRLELIQAAMGDQVTSWTSFAIKFALIHPVVTSLIVGLNSVEQVDQVLDAADGIYPDRGVFYAAREIFRDHGAVVAP